MTSFQLLKTASVLQPALAGAGGMLGPLGSWTTSQMLDLTPEEQWELIGRSALGSSIGGLAGSLAGIPVSMATGVPFIPGMVLGGLLGLAGGGLMGAHTMRRLQKKRRKMRY